MTRRPWPDDPASHDEETSVMPRAEVLALIDETAAPDEVTAVDVPVLAEDSLTPDEHDEYAARSRPGRPVTWMIMVVSLAGALLAGHTFQRCTANTHSVEAPVR